MDDRYTAQSWLYFLVGTLFLVAYSRPFSVKRLKDWFFGRRELAAKTASTVD
jgi:hypothetical protein